MSELLDKLTINGKYRLILDVDYWQVDDGVSAIDWVLAKSHGVSAGIARMSIGGWYEDPTFIENILSMRRAGILNRAGYIAIDPSDNAAEHIKKAIGIIAALISAEIAEFGDYIPIRYALDVERWQKWEYINKQWVVTGSYSPSHINNITKDVAEAMMDYDNLDRYPMFYSWTGFIFEYMAGMIKKGEPDWLSETDLWLAHFGNTFEQSLEIENPGSIMQYYKFYNPDAPFLADNCKVLQFSSEVDSNNIGAYFGGEADDIDLNRTYLTEEEITYLFRGITEDQQPEEPGEDDETMPDIIASEFKKINDKLDEIKEQNAQILAKLESGAVVTTPEDEPSDEGEQEETVEAYPRIKVFAGEKDFCPMFKLYLSGEKWKAQKYEGKQLKIGDELKLLQSPPTKLDDGWHFIDDGNDVNDKLLASHLEGGVPDDWDKRKIALVEVVNSKDFDAGKKGIVLLDGTVKFKFIGEDKYLE